MDVSAEETARAKTLGWSLAYQRKVRRAAWLKHRVRSREREPAARAAGRDEDLGFSSSCVGKL